MLGGDGSSRPGISSIAAPESGQRSVRAILQPDGRWRLHAGLADSVAAQLVAGWGASLGPVIALEWECDDGIARPGLAEPGDLPARDLATAAGPAAVVVESVRALRRISRKRRVAISACREL